MKRHCRNGAGGWPKHNSPFTVKIGAHTHTIRRRTDGRGRRVDECGIFPERKQTQITITEREGSDRGGGS